VGETRFTDVRRFDSIDSTNRYLLDEARGGAPEGVVAVADHQRAGRGRLGRTWEAPPGTNLLVSVLLRPALPADSRHLASAVVALAAAEAMEARTGLAPGLKWPNDLLGPDGRKLAGVLAEADLGDPGPHRAPPIVVGIGINVGWPASDMDLPDHLMGLVTSLSQATGSPVDRDALLEAMLVALEPRVAGLETPAGRAVQAADLRRRCTTLGAPVRVELASGSFEGTAETVTDEGHLVVRTTGGPRTVVAGDVVHLRAAGWGHNFPGQGGGPE
jgi:BirA family transcriptional regulator, biotin operon repressor / biotin---[acetyl-CoA-carboxylase] ligase